MTPGPEWLLRVRMPRHASAWPFASRLNTNDARLSSLTQLRACVADSFL
ncbi:hypothetical protein [Nannocystis pusilla]